eukprot:snap_masked-scaffold_49-processed-gene-1.75-mRNA-1 protein AED:1.00 eAED:1.00 QI:0/0/0/0/1/1/2/0/292
MYLCDEEGFGPFIENNTEISPCFSELLPDTLAYCLFLIYFYFLFKRIINLPDLLSFKHSTSRYKAKFSFSCVQTLTPVITFVFIIHYKLSFLFSIARFYSYLFKFVIWFFATIIIYLEYKKGLTESLNSRIITDFWGLELFVFLISTVLAFFAISGEDDEKDIYQAENNKKEEDSINLHHWNDYTESEDEEDGKLYEYQLFSESESLISPRKPKRRESSTKRVFGTLKKKIQKFSSSSKVSKEQMKKENETFFSYAKEDTDPLTGPLNNQRTLQEHLQKLIEEDEEDDIELS